MYKNEEIIRTLDDVENIRPADRFRKERKSRKPEKKDYLTKSISVQIVVCTVIICLMFCVKSVSDTSFEKIKKEYLNIMKEDYTVSEVFTAIKNFSTFPKSSSQSVDAGMGGDDITLYTPASGTSFSPYYISSPVCVPVSGKISSGFGYRINPVTGVWAFHSGLDISADYGEKIKAAYYGVVDEIGCDDTSGKYVVLKHNEKIKTKYLHCSEILVKEGNVIRSGETIALVGSTGRSTGPHLHFTVEIDGIKVNPLYILKVHDGKV